MFCFFRKSGVKTDSDSIYDQHQMTALMFDRKKKQGTRLKAASHISITDTDAHLMQLIHFDP